MQGSKWNSSILLGAKIICFFIISAGGTYLSRSLAPPPPQFFPQPRAPGPPTLSWTRTPAAYFFLKKRRIGTPWKSKFSLNLFSR